MDTMSSVKNLGFEFERSAISVLKVKNFRLVSVSLPDMLFICVAVITNKMLHRSP